MRSRGPLTAIVLAILVASCGGRPSVTVSVAGETVPTLVTSTTEGTPCSTMHGDGPYPSRAPTIVRGPTPVAIRVDAEPGVRIQVWIYDIEAPTASGGPLEEFTLTGGGTYQSRSIVAARTYDVVVNVARSVLGFSSGVTHAFRVRVQSP
jgi:hypothetical protein